MSSGKKSSTVERRVNNMSAWIIQAAWAHLNGNMHIAIDVYVSLLHFFHCVCSTLHACLWQYVLQISGYAVPCWRLRSEAKQMRHVTEILTNHPRQKKRKKNYWLPGLQNIRNTLMADLGICCFPSLLIHPLLESRKTVIIQIFSRPEVLSG